MDILQAELELSPNNNNCKCEMRILLLILDQSVEFKEKEFSYFIQTEIFVHHVKVSLKNKNLSP